jgi:hypothetical protein
LTNTFDTTPTLLAEAFNGIIPEFVCDSPLLVERLQEWNLVSSYLDEYLSSERTSEAVVLAITDFQKHPIAPRYESKFGKSRVFYLPLAAFDPSEDVALYTIRLLLQSDFRAAVERNRQWIKVLQETNAPLKWSGAETSIRCSLGDVAQLMRPQLSDIIEPGGSETPGNSFEVGLVADGNDPTFLSVYQVDGTVRIDGVLCAHHRQMPSNILPVKRRAAEFVKKLSAHLPLTLEVRANRVRRCLADGVDVSDELASVTNERYELAVVEFAMGTNFALEGLVDWTFNSQMSEGVGALHLGVGDGLTGAHIDFVCCSAEFEH